MGHPAFFTTVRVPQLWTAAPPKIKGGTLYASVESHSNVAKDATLEWGTLRFSFELEFALICRKLGFRVSCRTSVARPHPKGPVPQDNRSPGSPITYVMVH
jgi:hypothetical protein